VVDVVSLGVGAGFGILGLAGIFCVYSILQMFKGDVMEQLFRFMVAGFVLITVVGYGDAGLILAGQNVPSGIFGAALMVSFALLLVGLVRLVLWNQRSKQSGIA
jgi:hypothetical protein